MHINYYRLLLAIVMYALCSAAQGVCVTSLNGVGHAGALADALNSTATAVDQTIEIDLEQGTYALGDLEIDQEYTGGNASIRLIGGFVPGADCKGGRSVDPQLTVVQAQSNAYLVFAIVQLEGELTVDGIKFENFRGGVTLGTIGDAALTVRNIIVTGVSQASALLVRTYDVNVVGSHTSRLLLENCLIYGNDHDGLIVDQTSTTDTGQILNCTVADNTGTGLVLGYIEPYMGKIGIFSSVFWNNVANDVQIVPSSTTPTIDYSDFSSISGTAAGSHNLDVDPGFVNDANGEFELSSNSPVINKGAAASTVTATFPGAAGYPSADIRGRTRQLGSRVDLGAYESTVNDNATQVVQITGDTSTGSTLRNAILVANSNANPTIITFNLANCPGTIQLTSPLPDITSDITIDGYSQAGTSPNTLTPGFNGNICVALDGNGTVDHALQTSGAGRLTVRGVGFGGFTTAAIRLSSGSGHVVSGNSFGSVPPNIFHAHLNKTGILIEGSASSSQIGSLFPSDRNVFTQATDAAIKLAANGTGHHTIQGNYFGFYIDGLVGDSNKYGVYLVDSGSNEISYNYIGNSQLNAIVLSGTGSNGNHLTANRLGIAPADGSAAGNGISIQSFDAPAIDIVSGAHDNFVGATGGTGGFNLIANNFGSGVAVEASAGTGNRIYGNNLIHDNAGFLPIDLGPSGATPNDTGDGDTGANNLQNYPILSQAVRIEAGLLRVSGFLQTQVQTPAAAQFYRLDFYWTDTCINPGDGTGPRGDLKRYIGYRNLFSDGSSFLASFSAQDTAAAAGLPKTGYVSAIATDAAGNTSEAGPCHTYFDDYVFTDGFDK